MFFWRSPPASRVVLFCVIISACLHSIFAEKVRPFAGRDDYYAHVSWFTIDATKHRERQFYVYSDAYAAAGGDAKGLVDRVAVRPKEKQIVVYGALNGLEPAVLPNGQPRLKMREVLEACWRTTGMKLKELKAIVGINIANDDLGRAYEQCRRSFNIELGFTNIYENIVVTRKEKDPGKKACWEALDSTVFSGSIRGAIRNFGMKKRVARVRMQHNNIWFELEDGKTSSESSMG